jgi:hypothetical protein
MVWIEINAFAFIMELWPVIEEKERKQKIEPTVAKRSEPKGFILYVAVAQCV